jgi:hypothetical protein
MAKGWSGHPQKAKKKKKKKGFSLLEVAGPPQGESFFK